jgi:hypothetical protein
MDPQETHRKHYIYAYLFGNFPTFLHVGIENGLVGKAAFH